MKFEKFLKHCGARGSIVETTEGQFLKLGGVFLKIPQGVNVLGSLVIEAPEYIDKIFDDFDDEELCPADLTGAGLPAPDAAPSKLQRIYTNEENGTISISNKYFGMIERSDHAYTFTEELGDDAAEGKQDALVITTGYGDTEYISGIILDDDFYYNTLMKNGGKIND